MLVHRAVAAAAPVGELAPYQVAQPVGVVQEALLEHLLVQPRAVEAGGHAELDVVDQRLVARRGQDAVGVVALVEHQALEHGLAVELDACARRLQRCAGRHSSSRGRAPGRRSRPARSSGHTGCGSPGDHRRRRSAGIARSSRGAKSRSARDFGGCDRADRRRDGSAQAQAWRVLPLSAAPGGASRWPHRA